MDSLLIGACLQSVGMEMLWQEFHEVPESLERNLAVAQSLESLE